MVSPLWPCRSPQYRRTGTRRDHPHRIGAGNIHILDRDRQIEIAFRFNDEIFKHARAVALVDGHALGQAPNTARRRERQHGLSVRGRIAPGVFRRDGQSERLAHDGERGPDRLPGGCRARHEIESRLLRKLAKFISGKRIHRGPELDTLLHIGLQPKAGRALPPVAHANRQGVMLAQESAAHADQKRVGVGTNVELVEPDFELGTIARFDRGEVRSLRLVKLGLAHVGRGPPRDLDHAGIVDTERAGGVDKNELGKRARDEWARRYELDRAHMLGEIFRKWHDAVGKLAERARIIPP